MTEADIKNLKSPLEEIEKIQEMLKSLGYKIRGFRSKRKNHYDFVLHLNFVGSSFFTGDKNSPLLAPVYKNNVLSENV